MLGSLSEFRLFKIVINIKPHKPRTFKVRVTLRKQAYIQKEVNMEVVEDTTLNELKEELIKHLNLPLEPSQLYFFTKFYSHEMRSSYKVKEIYQEHCHEIEGRILKKPLLLLKLADSSKMVKRLVTERTRIKELSNDLAHELRIDLLSSQFSFYAPGSFHELNPNSTMKQVGLQDGGVLCVRVNRTSQSLRPPLITRMIQTVKLRNSKGENIEEKEDYLEEPVVINRAQVTQVSSLTESKMKQINRAKSANPYDSGNNQPGFKEMANTTRKIALYKKQKIFSGLNVIGKCKNPRCMAFGEEVIISLGFGTLNLLGLINQTFCETCPYRDMGTNPPIEILDIIFKECAWQARGNKLTSGTIVTAENFDNKWFVVKDFENKTVFEVLNSYNWAKLDVYVKPL